MLLLPAALLPTADEEGSESPCSETAGLHQEIAGVAFWMVDPFSIRLGNIPQRRSRKTPNFHIRMRMRIPYTSQLREGGPVLGNPVCYMPGGVYFGDKGVATDPGR